MSSAFRRCARGVYHNSRQKSVRNEKASRYPVIHPVIKGILPNPKYVNTLFQFHKMFKQTRKARQKLCQACETSVRQSW